jgi:hypothetical protein
MFTHGSFACPHSVSFVHPVSAFEPNVAHCLVPTSALALVGIGFVDTRERRVGRSCLLHGNPFQLPNWDLYACFEPGCPIEQVLQILSDRL